MQCEIIRRQANTQASQLPNDLHPLLLRVFSNRGIRDAGQLDLSLASLLPISSLGHVEHAAALLRQALDANWKILIVGDFDADGATSTTLAVSLLQSLHANVDYLIPNRFDYGYGLTPEIVKVALQRSPDLIITVDNGIASNEGVDAAKAAGIHVLITDHHLPGEQLPNADVIVNPNSPGETFQSKSLAGVGVIFYVMAALVRELDQTGWFEQLQIAKLNMADYLDLVALGTVADVVPLDQNNRILVEQGLRRIRSGQGRAGINALCRVAGRSMTNLVSNDLGFSIGPRLNAAGRLEDMSIGIECLLANDDSTAMQLATELDVLNSQRREIESDMKQQAMNMLEALALDGDHDMPVALALYQQEWHQGVVGILASRIKEKWHRPVIAFASDGGGKLKGSARSIDGVHIRDVLDAISKRDPLLIEKFGGHAMAAGLTLLEKNFERFKLLFQQEVARWVNQETLHGSHFSDGELPAEHLSLDSAALLKTAVPWGQKFPEPAFDNEFLVIGQRIVGHSHVKLTLAIEGQNDSDQLDAIAFNQADEIGDVQGRRVRVLYQMDVNRYMGRESLQLIVRYLERP